MRNQLIIVSVAVLAVTSLLVFKYKNRENPDVFAEDVGELNCKVPELAPAAQALLSRLTTTTDSDPEHGAFLTTLAVLPGTVQKALLSRGIKFSLWKPNTPFNPNFVHPPAFLGLSGSYPGALIEKGKDAVTIYLAPVLDLSKGGIVAFENSAADSRFYIKAIRSRLIPLAFWILLEQNSTFVSPVRPIFKSGQTDQLERYFRFKRELADSVELDQDSLNFYTTIFSSSGRHSPDFETKVLVTGLSALYCSADTRRSFAKLHPRTNAILREKLLCLFGAPINASTSESGIECPRAGSASD